MEQKSRTLLVTGADGSIGSHLTEMLVKRGAKVKALSYYNSFNYWGCLEDIDCLNNQPIIIKGDGSPIRTYLYAGDLAHWLWAILIHGERDHIYNVGSDHKISIGDLATTVRDVAGTSNEIRILSSPSSGPSHCYAPDISETLNKLGLDVDTPLREAILKTLEYHRRLH